METPPPSCAHVQISGRVQGVGYRIATWRQAHRLGVTGWVRNQDDGRVEAWFEGVPAQVESMVQWCQQGPPAAQVTRVDVEIESPKGLHGFEIRD